MRNRLLAFVGALALTVLTAAGQALPSPKKAPIIGKAAPTAATLDKSYKPPRTPDGQPDLSGVWTNNTITPLQRPKDIGAKEFYTDAEFAEVQRRQNERLSQDEDEGEPAANHSGIEGAPAERVHYDHAQYGLDWLQSKIGWSRRTSLIVGTEGTIPPLTPGAKDRIATAKAAAKGHELDGPENRPLAARCIARANVGPPLLPTRYNSNFQIVQGPGYVAVETEEIHDARVIALTGRPHPPKSIRQWYGDSVGHWEGNTLVVDTTNFTDQNPFQGAQNLHVVERFTRADNDTILYQFTVEDPGMWTKPWSGEIPITKMSGQIYEYACHEANYGLENTLRGARVADAAAAKAK